MRTGAVVCFIGAIVTSGAPPIALGLMAAGLLLWFVWK